MIEVKVLGVGCANCKTLALRGQGLKKSPIGQKLDFASHSYLCKGLYKVFNNNYYPLDNSHMAQMTKIRDPFPWRKNEVHYMYYYL
jgi:hypothetical protein